MTTSHNKLPQMSDQIFLTDGGLETSLIFEKNIHLPEFAAFGLVESTSGMRAAVSYWKAPPGEPTRTGGENSVMTRMPCEPPTGRPSP
jgi:hypothetical protein